MRRSRGFTIVELVVVMVVMAVLLALGMANISSSQASARDKERQADVEAIARGLERRYSQGNLFATDTLGIAKPGQYSSMNEMLHAQGGNNSNFTPTTISGGYLTDLLPGTTKESFVSPNKQSLKLSCVYACASGQVAGVMSQITPFTDAGSYVYEPVNANGIICFTKDCVRFYIYYKRESDGTLVKVSSIHQ